MIKGLLVGLMAVALFVGCIPPARQVVSDSGVGKVSAKIETGSDGFTTEQRNIKDRIQLENKPGSIKHLYIISPYTGDVLIYSTVRGKVTSSGKRLTPKTVNWSYNAQGIPNEGGSQVFIGGKWYVTNELLQDDGTYGDSAEYLYWFDANGRYFQVYVGGLTPVLSDQPIPISKSKLNTMELE